MNGRLLEDTLWQQIIEIAHLGGLDAPKFNDTHREIVREIVQFLNTPRYSHQTHNRSRFLRPWKFRRSSSPSNQSHQQSTAVPPIILSGIPGTGKTTFLYLLDTVLRENHRLPDFITNEMMKPDGTSFSLQKRFFCGRPISLLSVRKWTELLYFYNWDVSNHGFNEHDQISFIQTYLTPMRILFADEVEMTGYSPTIPNLAKHGILVVGTSNQEEFAQLDSYLIPPKIYSFSGEDMRSGNPEDAIVTEEDANWRTFDLIRTDNLNRFDNMPFRSRRIGETAVVLIPFYEAINAPLLESGWIRFFQQTHYQFNPRNNDFTPDTKFLLLLDDFSLAQLQGNFNAIIRFVTLFDVIEQFGIGVLVRNSERTPRLSKEAIHQMKIAIKTRPGVNPEVKTRTLAGIDRWISRLGQAGFKARTFNL